MSFSSFSFEKFDHKYVNQIDSLSHNNNNKKLHDNFVQLAYMLFQIDIDDGYVMIKSNLAFFFHLL